MNPLVTIIVPTYYRPVRLCRALESIAAQTFKDFETIVINDGGEDVGNVIKNFEDICYLSYVDNRGLPAARNYGIQKSQGKYIAYLDDDDWYYPNHLEVCMKYMNQDNKRFVYTNADALCLDGKVRTYIDQDYNPKTIKLQNVTPVNCVLHERSLFDEVGYFDEKLSNHEDWDLWIRMSKYTDFYHIHETTCCIDRSRATMSSNTNKMNAGYEFIKARYKETV